MGSEFKPAQRKISVVMLVMAFVLTIGWIGSEALGPSPSRFVMGFFSRLFGNKPQGNATGDHAVIIHFDYGSTDLTSLFALEDQLEEAINGAGVGEFDGNEIAVDGSDGSLYMYGPNGDRLFETVRPVLERSTAIRNAVATIRYGPPEDNVRSMNVPIKPIR